MGKGLLRATFPKQTRPQALSNANSFTSREVLTTDTRLKTLKHPSNHPTAHTPAHPIAQSPQKQGVLLFFSLECADRGSNLYHSVSRSASLASCGISPGQVESAIALYNCQKHAEIFLRNTMWTRYKIHGNTPG